MDKRQSVIESIQKLLALNVSDTEIAENLFDVGISKDEAASLIIEAKGVKQTPIQTQGTFTVGTPPQTNSPSQKQSSTIQTKSSPSQNSPPSFVPNQNSNLNQKSSKAVFDETITKLSMNDQVISQIPFDKQKVEREQTNAGSVPREDVAGRIIMDVARQSDPSEVGADIKQESDTQIEESISEAESETLDNEDSNTTGSINDEENEDEFESQVKQTLSSAKKETPQTQTQNNIPNRNFNMYSKSNPSSINSTLTSTKNQNSYNQNSSNFSSPPFSNTKKYSASVSLDSSPDFEELWKKGIVVAVNAKLGEMKRLKEGVDLEINRKVDEAVRKELYQFKVLNDSQKDLLISSNKEALDQKQKEITFIIDAKIAELKQYNRQLSETLKIIEESKKQQEASFAEIKLALDEAKKTKAQLIVEVNSGMIKTKSQAQAFIDSASLQLRQMDERVNKTLELEKNIAEGMLAQAEQKIEQLAISKADELISKMEVELNKLQSINKKISPEMLDQKIQTIEKFKSDFITNMQANLAQINSVIEELNKKNELAQSTLEEKTLAIDAKMEELTKFENQFTQMMDNILSKS